MKKFASTFFLLFTTVAGLSGAQPEIRATLRPDTVLIGDRFSIEVLVDKDMMQLVSFPSFDGGKMSEKIEILSETPLDTLEQNGRRQVLRKAYELTSFDAGVYDLGGYPVLYGDKNITDTLYSRQPLRLVVNTFPVDTEKDTVYDIKAPEQAPLLVSEFAGYVAAAFISALIAAALVILIRRMLAARRKHEGKDGRPIPSIAPHVRAIKDLETLHNQKLWQSGKTKTYFTRLTDIIRIYLNGRYGINAMEMTSDEIMKAVGSISLSERNRTDLLNILLTADLVKFAKHTPSPEKNDSLYDAAYYFVEDTKEQPVEQQETENDKRVNDEG